MAEDILDGVCCACCNQYFVDAHGYPVLCGSCYDPDSAEYPEASHPLV
jgi:hypothetical protein